MNYSIQLLPPAGHRSNRERGGRVALRLLGPSGTPLDAALSLDRVGDPFGIVVESAGGGRYADYNAALDLVLERLVERGVTAIRVHLVSDDVPKLTGAKSLLLEPERPGEGVIPLAGRDPRTLRLAICRAAAGATRRPGAKGGGNRTKRLLLELVSEADEWTKVFVAPIAESAAGTTEERSRGRKRVMASITRRRGQPAFRKRLLRAYGGRCAVTGTAVEAILEAAHIEPYDGDVTNDVANGILLRADVHTLYDLGLLTIDADGLIHVSETVEDEFYRALGYASIRFPEKASDRPDLARYERRLLETALERRGAD